MTLSIHGYKGTAPKYRQFWLVGCPHDACVAETYGMGKNALFVFLNWFQSVRGTYVSPCHLGGYQSKSVSLKWRVLPGCCTIHLFVRWDEGHNWSSTRVFCAVFITQGYLGFLSFFWCLIAAYSHLLVHSHVHKILWFFFFSNQAKRRTGVCGVLLRIPPIAQCKMVSRRFPKCLYFLFHYPERLLCFPLGPRAAASSLTPTSCYSEISLFILDAVILPKHCYFPEINFLCGRAC